jgi:MFS family permease
MYNIAAYLQKLKLFSRDVRLYLITVALIGFTMNGIWAVLFNLYLLRLEYTPEFIGLVHATSMLAFSIFCVPAGTLGTRWGGRHVLIMSTIMLTIGNGLLPLAEFIPAPWQAGWLLATSAFTRFGLAAYYVNSMPFVMGVTRSEERNHAFSMQVALEPLAGFAGSLIGGTLPEVFAAVLHTSLEEPASFRYPLLINALLFIPGVLALLFTGKGQIEQTPGERTEAGRAPYILIALIAVAVALRLAGRMTVVTFFNVYLDAGLHISTALIGVLAAIGKLLSVPAALITPLLIERWGKERAIILGSFGIALSILPLALVPHWSAAGVGFIGVTALFSVTSAPIRVYSQEIVSPEWRAMMSAALTMGAGLSASAMAFGGGYMITSLGYSSVFLAGAGLTTLGGLIFWAHFRVLQEKFAIKLEE